MTLGDPKNICWYNMSKEMGKIRNKHYGNKYPIHNAQMAMCMNETKN